MRRWGTRSPRTRLEMQCSPYRLLNPLSCRGEDTCIMGLTLRCTSGHRAGSLGSACTQYWRKSWHRISAPPRLRGCCDCWLRKPNNNKMTNSLLASHPCRAFAPHMFTLSSFKAPIVCTNTQYKLFIHIGICAPWVNVTRKKCGQELSVVGIGCSPLWLRSLFFFFSLQRIWTS